MESLGKTLINWSYKEIAVLTKDKLTLYFFANTLRLKLVFLLSRAINLFFPNVFSDTSVKTSLFFAIFRVLKIFLKMENSLLKVF